MRTALAIVTLASVLAQPSFVWGAAPNWPAVAGEKTITALVHKEDGSTREVTIWLAVVDGQGYIRTRNTSWRAAFASDPKAALRVAGKEYPVHVSPVSEEPLYARVNQTFRAKYGLTPHVFLAMMRPFMGRWNVYRVDGR
jgi:hypothetical protein